MEYAFVEATTEFGGDIDWKIVFESTVMLAGQGISFRPAPHGFRAWIALHYYLFVTGLACGVDNSGDCSRIWFVLGGFGTKLLFRSPENAAKHFKILVNNGEGTSE